MWVSRLVILVVIIVSATACFPQDKEDTEFRPDVRVTLSADSIEVSDGSYSEEFITVNLVREDADARPITMKMEFTSDIKEIRAVNASGGKIEELSTRELKGKGASDTLQFKVYGTNGAAKTSTFPLDINMYFVDKGQERLLEHRQIDVNVVG